MANSRIFTIAVSAEHTQTVFHNVGREEQQNKEPLARHTPAALQHLDDIIEHSSQR